MRHSTELAKLYKAESADLSCLLIYSDGGPDHNVTFLKTILALILLFLALDLDFLVAARTCARMSWKNAVEKVMCILNLAMYGVVLVRGVMAGDMEAMRKATGSSMDAIRKAAVGSMDGDKLKDAILDATKPVKELLQARYNKLELKGVQFKGSLEGIVSTDEMLDLLALITVIEPLLTRETANLARSSAELKTMQGLQSWVEQHVTQRAYFVVVGKYCQRPGAQKCIACKPVVMDQALWCELCQRDPLLPDPEPSALPEQRGEWAKYAELVQRQSTSEEYRP